MLVLPLIVVLLVWYGIICYKWKKNIFDYMAQLPGMKWYPIFGTTYAYIGVTRSDILYKVAQVVDKYRPFFKSWNGNIAEVNIMKPDHFQIVMRSSSHTTKGALYQYLFPWLGEGLFISEGAKWFSQRKLLTPTFHFKILDSFIDVSAEKSRLLVEKLESRADGKYFNILPDVLCCTLSIICETGMGVSLKSVTDKPLEYIKNVYGVTEMAMWRYWRPYLSDWLFYILPQGRQYKKFVEYLHEFSLKIIARRKELHRNSNQTTIAPENDDNEKGRTSFMDLALDATNNKNIMSNSDLQALVNTFLAAGFETTGNTASWAMFLLGNYPDIQEKVHEEVKRVLKGKAAPTTMEELNELKYLGCVVKETLRLYPVLPIISRTLTEDVEIDNCKIPAGTQALLHVFQVQRDPEHFPEPHKFDPDRFLPENMKNRHPFAYIPFSAGPRNCIGMRFAQLELKVVLAAILNKIKVTSLDTPEELKLFAHVLLRPQTGINVKLKSR